MILPIPNLNAIGYSVNARGCRGFREAINIAGKLRAKHHLPHLVLINAYGNGGVNADLISDALKVLGRKRVLGLVTEYNADTGHPPAPDTDVLFKAARQYPHRIFVLDWVKLQPPPPRRRTEARRLVPAGPLPPELHRRGRLRPVPGSGAAAGMGGPVPALAVDPAAVFVAVVDGEAVRREVSASSAGGRTPSRRRR